ncbi:NrsF family protein [Dongia deserti]|uniref:NrsF family protein n=1 Tax=Dongia deserti TaxID=2268030 RepID=UPI000E647C43|nr:DUF1109 domain-containing protein [Dongia deserti]
MIATPDLINALAASATPVRRLRPPLTRAAFWLLVAALVVGLLAVSQGIRNDLLERLRDPIFAIAIAATLLTGILATISAFMVSLPDRSRFWPLLPAPAVVLWFSTIGYQCLTDWVHLGPGGIALGETARCFATLALTSLPLSLVLGMMLRHAAPLRPGATALMGSLAVAAITATALSLFHEIDATIMILVWNLGAAALFVALGGLIGPRLLRWAAR